MFPKVLFRLSLIPTPHHLMVEGIECHLFSPQHVTCFPSLTSCSTLQLLQPTQFRAIAPRKVMDFTPVMSSAHRVISGVWWALLFQGHNGIWSSFKQGVRCPRMWVSPIPEYGFFWVIFFNSASHLCRTLSVFSLVMGSFSPSAAVSYNN